MEATQQHNTALHRYAYAHGAAYGRLSAHTAGLHQQLTRQLSGLLHLCRHLALQLATTLSVADPLASLWATAAGGSSGEGGAAAAVELQAAPASPEASAAAVAAAALSIESVRTELAVSVQLLEMQASSAEAQQLAAVPAGIAEALATDLAGLPPTMLASPRLAPAGLAAMQQPAGSPPAQPSAPLQPPATVPAVAVAGAVRQQAAVSALSAQVAQMEAHLERLVCTGAERAAAAAAATQLHQVERAERQRAQDVATQLAAQLAAMQAG